MEHQWIIIYGGVVSGLSFIGPFEDHATAVEHALLYKLHGWEVAELDMPESTLIEESTRYDQDDR